MIVKRTGPEHLGDNPAWRCYSDPDDPQWWGREATFYESDLAVAGWPADARAAHCLAVDDHDGCRDIWLESVDIPALSLSVFERAAVGLAHWQVVNAGTTHGWLARDWIPTHVARHRLDNARTLDHPGWGTALARGLDPAVRAAIERRATDPGVVRRRLAEFPAVLTHFDFHHANIGTVGDDVVIIDWAYPGWGPIGHDVGHLAVDACDQLGLPLPELWTALETAYCSALADAGWPGDLDVVRRSMALSNTVRLGWAVDHLLGVVDRIPDEALRAFADKVRFLAELAEVDPHLVVVGRRS